MCSLLLRFLCFYTLFSGNAWIYTHTSSKHECTHIHILIYVKILSLSPISFHLHRGLPFLPSPQYWCVWLPTSPCLRLCSVLKHILIFSELASLIQQQKQTPEDLRIWVLPPSLLKVVSTGFLHSSFALCFFPTLFFCGFICLFFTRNHSLSALWGLHSLL